MKRSLPFLISFAILGCVQQEKPITIIEKMRVVSSSGNIAYISESKSELGELTHVLVEFPGGKCGAGVAHAYDKNLNLVVSWLSASTLEISHPANVKLGINTSGHKLQCSSEFIYVTLKEINGA